MRLPYLSITGLRRKRPWYALKFWRHAFAAMASAQRSPGCLHADAQTINGVHHTRSLWTDRQAMVAYLRGDAHRRAGKEYSKIATGKVLGFEADEVPSWDEVHRLWEEKGRPV